MAVTFVKKSMEQKFFEQLGSDVLLQRYLDLKAAGVSFVLNPFNLSVKLSPTGPTFTSEPMPKMTSVVVNGPVLKGADPLAFDMVTGVLQKLLFTKTLNSVVFSHQKAGGSEFTDHLSPTPSKYKASDVKVTIDGTPVTGADLNFADSIKEAKDFISQIPTWNINATVPMKDPKARRIGQAVKGSSSTYRVVAFGPHYVVAANRKYGGTSLSLRVEGSIPATDKLEFASLGLTEKGDYMSGHIELGECPVERAFGAMFFNSKLHLTAKMASLTEANLG